jgi:preprotein translocase subunit YajC
VIQLLVMAQPQGGSTGGGGGLITFFVPLVLMFVIIYFFMIRPQQKRQKEHNSMLSALKKGDKVVTNGGMYGTIWGIDEKENKIVLKFGEDLKIEFLKSAIAGRVDEK